MFLCISKCMFSCFPFLPTQKVTYYICCFAVYFFLLNHVFWKSLNISSQIFLILVHRCIVLHFVYVLYVLCLDIEVSNILQLWIVIQWITSYMYILGLLDMCLHCKDQRVNAYVLWLDTVNFSSIEIVPFCIPTSSVWKCLFSHSLFNRVYCQAFGFLQSYRWDVVS